MPTYPELLPNPAGSGASYGSAAAGVANALQSAANQEATRKALEKREKDAEYQRGLQQDFSNALELQKNNYVPATVDSAPPGRPTLALPQDNPAYQDATGPTITDRNGQVWRQKSKDQLATEDPRNFVPSGALADMLQAAGRDPKKPISPTDSHDIMQSLNEANAQMKGEPFHIDTSGKFRDASGKSVPVMIGDKTGTVRILDLSGGQSAPMQPGDKSPQPFTSAFDQQKKGPIEPGTTLAPATGGNAPASFALPDKTPKAAKNLHFVENTNDKGDVVTRGFDPETGELKSTTVAKGIGGTRKDPNATPAAKPPSPAQLRMVVTAKTKALKAANDAYAKAVAPIGGAGGVQVSAADKAEAGVTMRKAHQQAQLDYEEGIAALTGNEIPHNDWADKALEEAENPPAQPAAKAEVPAKAAPAAPAAKPAAPPAQPTAAPAAQPPVHQPPPPDVVKALAPGTHTFGNGQVWKKGRDGSITYVSGGQ